MPVRCSYTDFDLKSLLAFLLASGLYAAPHFDLIIRGGTIVDGTGQQRFRADIGIAGDTIQVVGNLEGVEAPRVIDATRQIVTPGFVDLHNHGDDDHYGAKGLRSPDARRRADQNYITQGVTTVVVNPDGRQPPSLIDQRRELTRLGVGPNVVLLNGHNTLREQAMGSDLKRPANAAEIAKMQEILRRGLEQEGSFGISLGTEYFSGICSFLVVIPARQSAIHRKVRVRAQADRSQRAHSSSRCVSDRSVKHRPVRRASARSTFHRVWKTGRRAGMFSTRTAALLLLV
jgi:N-acyl-D-aspartate/D-glutamate deacylase